MNRPQSSSSTEGPGDAVDSHSRFNLSAWVLRHKSLAVFFVSVATLFGVIAYGRLGQSEDPPFTFRIMVVRTEWPGATAREIQQQVTDRITRKLQETPFTDFIRSYSRPGESLLFYSMKDSAPADIVPEQWYQVRKKVGDIAATLPKGVKGPYFNDEFGDVYTNIYTLQGDGFSPAQLHDYADLLRTVLLRVPGVDKVDYIGDQTQRLYVEVSNTQLTRLDITPDQIGRAINGENAVANSGTFELPNDRVYVRAGTGITDVARLADTLIRTGGRSVRLGDIATIKRGYADPADPLMRSNGHNVLGIAISMQPGEDVVQLGHDLDRTTATLQHKLPAGLTLHEVSSMPHTVSKSVNQFLEAVAEAIAIVLVVSFASLGLRAGMVVAITIPIVLAVTALFMYFFDIGLHKISLGALILSLGLLVDDAIIAVEMMAVKLEQGWDRSRAAIYAYTTTAFPMLTGTLVTVSGFLPIALAKSGTGEYTRSIFEVSAISLLVSWLAAVGLIPLLGYRILRERTGTDLRARSDHEIYDTRFYFRLRNWLGWCIERRFVVIGVTALLFVLALAGFAIVPKQFFPSSDRPELLVDLRLQEGASIAATLRETKRLEKVLAGRSEIDHMVDFVGSGAPHFVLTLDQQLPQPNFGQFVITTRSAEERERLANWLGPVLKAKFPGVRTRLSRIENGPPAGYPVQFRVSGDDIAAVRKIAQQVFADMRADNRTVDVQYDWDEPSERSLHFEIDQQKARELGVDAKDIKDFLAMSLSGYSVTQYRENDKLIDVDLRTPPQERMDPSRLTSLAIPTPNGSVPLGSLGRVVNDLEYAVIWERDRQPTITVQSDVVPGAEGIDVTNSIDAKIAELRATLPIGYRIETGGPQEAAAKGQSSLNAPLSLTVVVVLTLLMVQLQGFGRVWMVVLTAPLGLIGVVMALLLFHKPLGFVALLGVIAMFGIIMRNSVILVDQIERDIAAGYRRFDAIVSATVRRFRPITLTAAAAVLALIPLLPSNFFGPMATALMGGLTSATVLTLFFLPALYAAWFRVRSDERQDGAPRQPLPKDGHDR